MNVNKSMKKKHNKTPFFVVCLFISFYETIAQKGETKKIKNVK